MTDTGMVDATERANRLALQYQADGDALFGRHRDRHEHAGTAIHVSFPPDAPYQVVEAFMASVVTAADELPRDGWDPYVYATKDTPR